MNKILIIIFALILSLPLLDGIFHFSPVKQLFEKRNLAEMPKKPKSFIEIKNYPKKFENYFNDNYGFRKTFIAINSYVMDNVFNVSPDTRAVRGKEDWLYFDNYNSLLDAQGKINLDDKLIARGIESFYRNWQKLKKKNIEYLLVIAADKSTIYAEFLPDYLRPKHEIKQHRIDKFLNALKKKYPDFPVLDLRPILFEAKNNEVIYHKTDTHWNALGAHYGYVAIMNVLGKEPHLREEFIVKDDKFFHGDIANIMGLSLKNRDYYLEPKFTMRHYPIEVTKKDREQFHLPEFRGNKIKDLDVVFVYKDSFFDNMISLFSEHFTKSYYINEFPCDLNYEMLKKYRPNIVIQEFWEGRIERVLQECK